MLFKIKSDTLGAVSGTLCLIHCLATPFLFALRICTVCQSQAAAGLWEQLDVIFLMISFVAIFYSVQHTSKKWMKFALWIGWCLLVISLLNERMEWMAIPELINYLPAVALIVLHVYNRKYCSCATEKSPH